MSIITSGNEISMSIITSLNIIVKHADEDEPDTSEDDEEYQIIMAVSGANDCRINLLW